MTVLELLIEIEDAVGPFCIVTDGKDVYGWGPVAIKLPPRLQMEIQDKKKDLVILLLRIPRDQVENVHKAAQTKGFQQ